MKFLARLRRYLERVGRAPDGLPYVMIDVAAHKRFLLEKTYHVCGYDSEEAERIERLLDDQTFDIVIWSLANEILDEVELGASAAQLARLLEFGITMGVDAIAGQSLDITTGSAAKDHLLKKMAELYFPVMEYFNRWHEWEFPQRYAFETRLIRRHGDRAILSPSGRTFLEMSGIAAVHWLVTLEAAQSLGVEDEFRMPIEVATHLATERNVDMNYSLFSRSTMDRLEEFGLLQATPHGAAKPRGYTLNLRHLPLLEEIAQRKATPYALLADALLRDETNGFVERAHPNTRPLMQESAAETYALQARMVVHEIRNALLPAQVAFSSIASILSSDDQAVQKRRARVDGGIQRALEFVDNMLRVANLGVEQPSTFDIAGALRDACVSLSRELNGGFQQHIDITDAIVFGPRARFVLTVTNLLRNAAQSIAGIANGRVSITTERDTANVLVHVDDNGPGVPEANRSVIFEPGVTLRAGGSGQGLALVRQVVEGEMRGTVTCTNGPLGGARFTVSVPLQPRST